MPRMVPKKGLYRMKTQRSGTRKYRCPKIATLPFGVGPGASLSVATSMLGRMPTSVGGFAIRPPAGPKKGRNGTKSTQR
eukprot:COSAG02_NODE_1267_length_13538_cov_11.820746_2_plen_79_part_00